MLDFSGYDLSGPVAEPAAEFDVTKTYFLDVGSMRSYGWVSEMLHPFEADDLGKAKTEAQTTAVTIPLVGIVKLDSNAPVGCSGVGFTITNGGGAIKIDASAGS